MIAPIPQLGHKPLIMGIVNVTPDSFSGDGLLMADDYVGRAVLQAVQMAADGADILDVGGESTRPGGEPVPADEEIRRALPVIREIRKSLPEMPISIDTMKPAVAQMALKAGATILNDVSGAATQSEMMRLAAQSGAYLVLMHNEARADHVARTATIGGEYGAADYADVVADVRAGLAALAARAQESGVARDRIILDPGIGFGKSLEQNLRLINELDRLSDLGFPILLGVSRKSFIGRVLDVPPEERLEGTAAATAIGALRGAAIHRVHDVRFMARVVKMVEAVRRE